MHLIVVFFRVQEATLTGVMSVWDALPELIGSFDRPHAKPEN